MVSMVFTSLLLAGIATQPCDFSVDPLFQHSNALGSLVADSCDSLPQEVPDDFSIVYEISPSMSPYYYRKSISYTDSGFVIASGSYPRSRYSVLDTTIVSTVITREECQRLYSSFVEDRMFCLPTKTWGIGEPPTIVRDATSYSVSIHIGNRFRRDGWQTLDNGDFETACHRLMNQLDLILKREGHAGQ